MQFCPKCNPFLKILTVPAVGGVSVHYLLKLLCDYTKRCFLLSADFFVGVSWHVSIADKMSLVAVVIHTHEWIGFVGTELLYHSHVCPNHTETHKLHKVFFFCLQP